MEFTSGRANITLPFDIAPNDGNNVDAMWQFSYDQLGSSPRIGLMHEGKRTIDSTCNLFQADETGAEGNYLPKNRCKGKPHQSRHTSNT